MGSVRNIARERMVKIAINSPEAAARELRVMADGLEQCRNAEDTVYALMSIYGVGERTIDRDSKG